MPQLNIEQHTNYVVLFARDIFMQYLLAEQQRRRQSHQQQRYSGDQAVEQETDTFEQVGPMFKLFIKQTTKREGRRQESKKRSLKHFILNEANERTILNEEKIHRLKYALHAHDSFFCVRSRSHARSSFLLNKKKKQKKIRICMIFNSKLKPLSQKNEYLFRYINKRRAGAGEESVGQRKSFGSHSFLRPCCVSAHIFHGKVSHFNMISVCRFSIQEMVQVFWCTLRFDSDRFGSVLNAIAKSVRSLGI